MRTLLVPKQYQTIQAAIDAATPGDTIIILPTTTYAENLRIIGKNNITIIAESKTIIIDGSKIGGTSLLLESDNVVINGLYFLNFTEGVTVTGRNNKLRAVTVKGSKRSGFVIKGSYNQLISCIASGNGSAGIDTVGNYNQFIACRVDENQRGFTATTGDLTGNVIYKNILLNNEEFAMRISNPQASNTVLLENTISGSLFGMLCNFGRVAIIANYVNNCSNTGIIYKDNGGIIVENNLVNNNEGMYLETCNTLVAANVVQSGKFSGITAIGNDNVIIQNIITDYSNTGLVVNGCENKICNNKIEKNGVREIINGEQNTTDCYCTYCKAVGCADKSDTADNTNFLGLLDIFKQSNECFYTCSKSRPKHRGSY